MKGIIVFLVLVVGGAIYYFQFMPVKGPAVTVEGDRVTVVTGDLQASFSSSWDFDETYMVFGALHLPDKNSISPVSFSNLSMLEARPIYASYPDFTLCKSPGAKLAMPAVQDMSLIPDQDRLLRLLIKAVGDHDQAIKSDGDRVCLKLTGKRLDLQKVEIVAEGFDVTDKMGNMKFYLVTAAERTDCQAALSAG